MEVMKEITRYCRACGTQIPQGRLQALPTASTCVPCAENRVQKKIGVPVLVGGEEHGYTDLVVMENENFIGQAEMRDIADVEPEVFAKDKSKPVTIPKRQDVI